MSIEQILERIADSLETLVKLQSIRTMQDNPVPIIQVQATEKKSEEPKRYVSPEAPKKAGRPPKVKAEEPKPQPESETNTDLFDKETAPEPVGQVKRPVAGPLTIEMVRTAVAKHVNTHGTDSLKKILKEFDAEKIVDIAVTDYADVIERLGA